MVVTALQSFRCNGVVGTPEKVLTEEDLVRIGSLLDSLAAGLLVRIDEPAPPTIPELAPTDPVEPVEPVKPAKRKRRA